MQTRGMRTCSLIPECSLSYAKMMQMSGKQVYLLFPEYSLSYAKNNVYKKKRKHGGYEQPYFPLIKNTIREFYFKRLFDQILLVLYYVDSRL